jgi:hypothetical protein
MCVIVCVCVCEKEREVCVCVDWIRKGGRVQIFGNNFNKSKLYSGRNLEQIEVRQCLLSFGAEYFVFQFAIQKYKY